MAVNLYKHRTPWQMQAANLALRQRVLVPYLVHPAGRQLGKGVSAPRLTRAGPVGRGSTLIGPRRRVIENLTVTNEVSGEMKPHKATPQYTTISNERWGRTQTKPECIVWRRTHAILTLNGTTMSSPGGFPSQNRSANTVCCS